MAIRVYGQFPYVPIQEALNISSKTKGQHCKPFNRNGCLVTFYKKHLKPMVRIDNHLAGMEKGDKFDLSKNMSQRGVASVQKIPL